MDNETPKQTKEQKIKLIWALQQEVAYEKEVIKACRYSPELCDRLIKDAKQRIKENTKLINALKKQTREQK